MTGKYNVRNYHSFIHSFGYLDVTQTTFAQVLKTSGYQTCIAGKWQLNGSKKDCNEDKFPPLRRAEHFGFDRWCLWQTVDKGRMIYQGKKTDGRYGNPVLNIDGKMTKNLINQYGSKVILDYTLDFISENKDKPFLVYYPMILTHCPFWPTPDSPEWKDPDRRMPRHYYRGDPNFFQTWFPTWTKWLDA